MQDWGHARFFDFMQGVPDLLLMLGPTKAMSSRRANVPAMRSAWVVASAAGILNGDRNVIPATCYMLSPALHLADDNICHSWCLARRRHKGQNPHPNHHCCGLIWGLKPSPSNDDDSH